MTLRLAAVLLALGAGLLLAAPAAPAQEERSEPDAPITAEVRAEVIEGALQRLRDGYVFPETAAKMEAAIRDRMAKKEYDGIASGRELARVLTAHLQEVSRDRHLRILFHPEGLRFRSGEPTPEEKARFQQEMRAANFGFEKVERLPGNLGYLDFRHFADPEAAGDTVAAAFGFLANADALIVDLRRNGGGTPAMVQLLCSYLLGPEPVHLNDIYWRPDGSTRQYWTLPYVPGRRFLEREVYVLTSRRTFSGAEEFAYNLKSQKRATIVGETTGGGAHPGGVRPINDRFAVWVPMGRAINPITGTNWEGTGVEPDIAAPADQALLAAQLAALRKLREKADALRAVSLTERIQELETELARLKEKSAGKK